MRLLLLWVDLPDKRLAGPLCAQEGIFAADKVDVAAPQEAVEVILWQKLEGKHLQLPDVPRSAPAKCFGHGGQRLAGRHMQANRQVGSGKCVEQASNWCRVVAEQTDIESGITFQLRNLGIPSRQQVFFTQQTAAGRRKTGKVEVLDQRQGRVG
mgnify:CR=1 FL=1